MGKSELKVFISQFTTKLVAFVFKSYFNNGLYLASDFHELFSIRKSSLDMRLEPTAPDQDAVLDEVTVVRYIHIVTTSHS